MRPEKPDSEVTGMNENEILRQIKNCDAEIKANYGQMKNADSAVGKAAESAAANKRIIQLAIPLVVTIVIALLIYASDHPFIAFMAGALGLYLTYPMSASGTTQLNNTRRYKQDLDNTISRLNDINA